MLNTRVSTSACFCLEVRHISGTGTTCAEVAWTRGLHRQSLGIAACSGIHSHESGLSQHEHILSLAVSHVSSNADYVK